MTHSYFYTKGERYMSKKQKIWIIVLAIFGLYILTGIIVGLSNSNDDGLPVGGYYFGEKLDYNDIDITVTKVTCELNSDETSKYCGLYRLKVYFTYKNNRTKEFEVKKSVITLKTEDKGEKYDAVSLSSTQKIIAGAEKSYWVSFYTPYDCADKHFIVTFDWGLLSGSEDYHLYYRNGNNCVSQETNTTDSNNDNLKTAVLGMRDELLKLVKNVYDNIDGSMYYSDVQKLMDSLEYQCEKAGIDVNVYLNLSHGSYFPRWDLWWKGYRLVYLEVECSSLFKVVKKLYGSYTVSIQNG